MHRIFKNILKERSEIMRVVHLESKKLVGLRVVCDGDQYVNEIPKASDVLRERLNQIRNVVNPERMVGAFVVGDCSDEEDGYWVCVEVQEYCEIPNGMVTLTIPAQRYAVIKHTGPNYEIRKTYEILHKWIEENEYERILSSWHLEISDMSRDGAKNVIEIELYDTIN
jgi:predicted transcriptional regulator YdeE